MFSAIVLFLHWLQVAFRDSGNQDFLSFICQKWYLCSGAVTFVLGLLLQTTEYSHMEAGPACAADACISGTLAHYSWHDLGDENVKLGCRLN